MSYSVCFECGLMVGAYEKYCAKCSRDKRENPSDFWKTERRNLSHRERLEEVAFDTLSSPERKQRELVLYEQVHNGANPNGNRAQRRKNAALQRRRT